MHPGSRGGDLAEMRRRQPLRAVINLSRDSPLPLEEALICCYADEAARWHVCWTDVEERLIAAGSPLRWVGWAVAVLIL